jgi:hypothetical protein
MTTTAIFVWLGWGLAGLGALVTAWALFRDRSRGRKRCPKCWYDMAGVDAVPAACSECGRVVRREQGLRRTRRRWAAAAVGIVVGAPGAWVVAHHDAMQARGWVAAVPSQVLVRIAPLQQHWRNATSYTGMDAALYDELDHRQTSRSLSASALRAYIDRHHADTATPISSRVRAYGDSGQGMPQWVILDPPWYIYELRYSFDVVRLVGPNGDTRECRHSQRRRFMCGNEASMRAGGGFDLPSTPGEYPFRIELVRASVSEDESRCIDDRSPTPGVVVWRKTVTLALGANAPRQP